jgi:hypothetical protein
MIADGTTLLDIASLAIEHETLARPIPGPDKARDDSIERSNDPRRSKVA